MPVTSNISSKRASSDYINVKRLIESFEPQQEILKNCSISSSFESCELLNEPDSNVSVSSRFMKVNFAIAKNYQINRDNHERCHFKS